MRRGIPRLYEAFRPPTAVDRNGLHSASLGIGGRIKAGVLMDAGGGNRLGVFRI